MFGGSCARTASYAALRYTGQGRKMSVGEGGSLTGGLSEDCKRCMHFLLYECNGIIAGKCDNYKEMKKRVPHSQEKVDIHGQKVMIDKDFMNLISELNKLGLNTTSSCQGSTKAVDNRMDYDPAYVVFDMRGNTFNYDMIRDTMTIYWNRSPTNFMTKIPKGQISNEP